MPLRVEEIARAKEEKEAQQAVHLRHRALAKKREKAKARAPLPKHRKIDSRVHQPKYSTTLGIPTPGPGAYSLPSTKTTQSHSFGKSAYWDIRPAHETSRPSGNSSSATPGPGPARYNTRAPSAGSTRQSRPSSSLPGVSLTSRRPQKDPDAALRAALPVAFIGQPDWRSQRAFSSRPTRSPSSSNNLKPRPAVRGPSFAKAKLRPATTASHSRKGPGDYTVPKPPTLARMTTMARAKRWREPTQGPHSAAAKRLARSSSSSSSSPPGGPVGKNSFLSSQRGPRWGLSPKTRRAKDRIRTSRIRMDIPGPADYDTLFDSRVIGAAPDRGPVVGTRPRFSHPDEREKAKIPGVGSYTLSSTNGEPVGLASSSSQTSSRTHIVAPPGLGQQGLDSPGPAYYPQVGTVGTRTAKAPKMRKPIRPQTSSDSATDWHSPAPGAYDVPSTLDTQKGVTMGARLYKDPGIDYSIPPPTSYTITPSSFGGIGSGQASSLAPRWSRTSRKKALPGPGPGAYKVDDTDVRIASLPGPKISLPSAQHQPETERALPGPQDYDVIAAEAASSKGPSHTGPVFGRGPSRPPKTRTEDQGDDTTNAVRNEIPGPAAYSISRDLPSKGVSLKGASRESSKAAFALKGLDSPGPAAYHVSAAEKKLLRSDTQDPAGFTLGSRAYFESVALAPQLFGVS